MDDIREKNGPQIGDYYKTCVHETPDVHWFRLGAPIYFVGWDKAAKRTLRGEVKWICLCGNCFMKPEKEHMKLASRLIQLNEKLDWHLDN